MFTEKNSTLHYNKLLTKSICESPYFKAPVTCPVGGISDHTKGKRFSDIYIHERTLLIFRNIDYVI